jgi:hypothetical protein
VISRPPIPPLQGRSLLHRRSVTISSIAQDHPLPDTPPELAGIDGRLGLLLPQHVLAVQVEVERLLPPPLLNQQDHQSAQGVFISRILLDGGEEQLLGHALALVLEVKIYQLEEDATPRPVDRAPPSLGPFSIGVVLKKLAPGEGMRLL